MVHTIKLKNQHGEIFYNKLTYIYLEMPNFHLQESELETRLDKWLYFFKYLEDFQSIPVIFRDEIFSQAFEKAELANFRQAVLDLYENSLKVFRDNKAVYDYAKQTAYEEGRTKGIEDGKAEGIAEGKIQEKTDVAFKLKQRGFSVNEIAEITGLLESEIQKL